MRKLALLILLVATTTFAFDVQRVEQALDAKTVALPPLAPKFDANAVSLYLTNPTWTLWNAAHGGKWRAQYDVLTARPRRVWGGAIPWSGDLETAAREFISANPSVLGVANAKLRFVPEPSSAARSGRVRFAAFDYEIDGVPVESGRLVFAVNNGKMIYWSSSNIAGVPAITTPVLSAGDALSRALAHAGVDGVNAVAVREPSLRLLPRNAPTGALLTYQLVYDTTFRLNGGEATWGAYVDALTGAIVAFGNINRYATCTPRTAGNGKVTGGVRPARATDDEVMRSFPFVAVDPGANSTGNGNFPYTGGSVSTGLNGTFFDTNCVDCVKSENDPQTGFQPFVSSSDGRLNLGTGGRDAVFGVGVPTVAYGNGTSTPADRTAFYHLNVARSIARKWLDLPWLQTNVGVNVNINDVCNAFWNGTSVNFFKSGEVSTLQCRNTGEIRDVMQHEWGHGLDDNDGELPGYGALGLGDFATGEAAADFIALFVDHDSCIGQSFFNRLSGPFVTDPDTMELSTCDGVRNIDELRATRGTLTATNVTSKCQGPPIVPSQPTYLLYIGPLLNEGHCEGEIWGQTGWHLVNDLLTGRKYGTVVLDANKQHVLNPGEPLPNGADGSPNPAFDRDAAWDVLERLYFESRPLVASYAPSRYQAMGVSAYDAFLVVDDEGDGLANGTPHAAYINDAYVHHGIEEWGLPGGVPSGIDSANCAAPAAPNVTLAQSIDPVTGTPAVSVSWTAVAGAAAYSVLRNERRNDVFLELARVTGGTSFVDAGVDNGVSYNYRVQAVGSGGCYGASGGGIRTITIAQPALALRTATVTDSPGGNNDGQLDAGERASLFLVLGNEGLTGLTNVTATLSSITAGVRVTKAGPRSYGSIAAGASAGPSQSYAVELDPNGYLCETDARLILNVTSDQGCFPIAISLPIGNAGASCIVHKVAFANPKSIAITSDTAGACGDDDGVPDPGEIVVVAIEVTNTGEKVANNVSVALASSKPYLVTGAARNIGTLAPLGAETKTVTFNVTVGTAPHDDVATLTTTVSSSGNTVPASRSLTTAVNRDKVLRTLAYDFESGAQGWTSSSPDGWHLGTAPSTGDLTTLWSSNYVLDRCDFLVSPPLEFGATSTLSFDLAHITEFDGLGYDGTDVQVSIDGGASWITLDLVQGYPAVSAGTTECIPLDGPMFAGPSPLMTRYDADLSPYAGHAGFVRFRFASDPLVDTTAGGVWVDNITAANAIVSVPDEGCQ